MPLVEWYASNSGGMHGDAPVVGTASEPETEPASSDEGDHDGQDR